MSFAFQACQLHFSGATIDNSLRFPLTVTGCPFIIAEDVEASLEAGMDVHPVEPVRMDAVGAAISRARVRRMALCA